jgi:hypothetical protein
MREIPRRRGISSAIRFSDFPHSIQLSSDWASILLRASMKKAKKRAKYLRSLIEVIEVDDHQVRVRGTRLVQTLRGPIAFAEISLKQLIFRNDQWWARQGSNL